MYPTTAILLCRRLLQTAYATTLDNSLYPNTASGDTIFNPINASSSTSASAAAAAIVVRRPFNSNTHFDSSMALTVLVLLTALFFMGFFSFYIRRFTAEEPSPPPPPPPPPLPNSSSRRPTTSNGKGGGLDPSAVNSLPLVAYGKATKHPMIDDCPICLSEFQEREIVKFIPYCSHVFHPRCIDTWLYSHVTCPLCRSAQLFNKVGEICLDVEQEKNDHHEIGETSSVENRDTWRNDGGGSSSSRSDSVNLAGLQRSTSALQCS